jgi:hypothetical protein
MNSPIVLEKALLEQVNTEGVYDSHLGLKTDFEQLTVFIPWKTADLRPVSWFWCLLSFSQLCCSQSQLVQTSAIRQPHSLFWPG